MVKTIGEFKHHFHYILKHKGLMLFMILTGISSSLMEGLGISFIFPLLEETQSASNIPFPFNKLTGGFSEFSVNERLQIIALFLVIIVMMKGIFKYASIIATCRMRMVSEKHFKMLSFEKLMNVGMGYFNNEKIGRIHTVCLVYTQYLGMFVNHIGMLIPLFSNMCIYLIMVLLIFSVA